MAKTSTFVNVYIEITFENYRVNSKTLDPLGVYQQRQRLETYSYSTAVVMHRYNNPNRGYGRHYHLPTLFSKLKYANYSLSTAVALYL